jgi:hypothetical protein
MHEEIVDVKRPLSFFVILERRGWVFSEFGRAQVDYSEVANGHNYANVQEALPDGLIALVGHESHQWARLSTIAHGCRSERQVRLAPL